MRVRATHQDQSIRACMVRTTTTSSVRTNQNRNQNQKQNMENDHNECPTCKQDWVADTDYECTACGRPASEHISVTSVCRILYETRAREASLIVERGQLLNQLAYEFDLSDRMANALLSTLSAWMTSPDSEQAAKALAAWKKSRQDGNHS